MRPLQCLHWPLGAPKSLSSTLECHSVLGGYFGLEARQAMAHFPPREKARKVGKIGRKRHYIILILSNKGSLAVVD